MAARESFLGSRGWLGLDAKGERRRRLWPHRWWVAVAAHGGCHIIPLHGHSGVRVSHSRCASGPCVGVGMDGIGDVMVGRTAEGAPIQASRREGWLRGIGIWIVLFCGGAK